MVLFFTVWFNFCSVFVAHHPMYFSTTNMDVDAKKGSIVLQIRIFTDDLEMILHNRYHVDGWIGTPAEHRDGRRLLGEYVNERFSITVNEGEKINLVTDSIAVVEDMMWFYMKGTARKSINRMEIDNRVLTDFYSNQNNIVIVHTGRDETGRVLNRQNHKMELSL